MMVNIIKDGQVGKKFKKPPLIVDDFPKTRNRHPSLRTIKK